MQAGSVALEGRVGTCLILLPTVQPAQGGMVLESRIVTYPHACRSMHMTLCEPIYVLTPKPALALAIASMLLDSKSSCVFPMVKVLLGED